jgi:hypothetical protein
VCKATTNKDKLQLKETQQSTSAPKHRFKMSIFVLVFYCSPDKCRNPSPHESTKMMGCEKIQRKEIRPDDDTVTEGYFNIFSAEKIIEGLLKTIAHVFSPVAGGWSNDPPSRRRGCS